MWSWDWDVNVDAEEGQMRVLIDGHWWRAAESHLQAGGLRQLDRLLSQVNREPYEVVLAAPERLERGAGRLRQGEFDGVDIRGGRDGRDLGAVLLMAGTVVTMRHGTGEVMKKHLLSSKMVLGKR
jgi:hypothetical protein